MDKAGELLYHYQNLLDLYFELESVSLDICHSLEDGRPLIGIVETLGEKKKVVERIEQESQTIAALKKAVIEHNLISDDERSQVRDAEGSLTEMVTRVVEQGEKTFELMAKQGVNVSRR